MMITNKCKEDFLKWLDKQVVSPYAIKFDEFPINAKVMYIIEFFDSENLYINTLRYGEKWRPIADGMISKSYNTRQEALIRAVKEANKIYNEKY